MNINYQNIQLFEKLYAHDCIVSGYCYDYEKRTIQLVLTSPLTGVNKKFVLNNVILSQFQSCSFWHGGNAVYYVGCHTEHPFWGQLEQVKKENAQNIEGSYLDMGIDYIVFELLINSGDSMYVICESVDYEEV